MIHALFFTNKVAIDIYCVVTLPDSSSTAAEAAEAGFVVENTDCNDTTIKHVISKRKRLKSPKDLFKKSTKQYSVKVEVNVWKQNILFHLNLI